MIAVSAGLPVLLLLPLSVDNLRHHTIKFQEVILLMAIIGIFFGSDTGNTENIAKNIQKQLGKDVADVHDIAKSSCCWASRPGTTVKHSVTGTISSQRWKK